MMNRREFLKSTVWMAIGASTLMLPKFPFLFCSSKRLPSEAKVIKITSKKVFNGENINREICKVMLERGIKLLSGKEDLRDALSLYFTDRDIIGIKTNCLAGRIMSTHIELAEGLVDIFSKSGINPNHMLFWERTTGELIRAGYTVNDSKNSYRCFGTDRVGYESELTFSGEVCSLLSTIITRECTALINFPVLKDHNLAGISGGMKNYYGAINNPNKYHSNNCNPFVADVNAMMPIREKNKFTICDALYVQFNNGPAYDPAGASKYGAILLSEDPVALDVICLEIIEYLRQQAKLSSLQEEKRYPTYLKTASQVHQLGIFERSKIKVIEEIID